MAAQGTSDGVLFCGITNDNPKPSGPKIQDGSKPLSLSLFCSVCLCLCLCLCSRLLKCTAEEFCTNSLQDYSLGNFTSWYFALSNMASQKKNVAGKAMRTMKSSRNIQASISPGTKK